MLASLLKKFQIEVQTRQKEKRLEMLEQSSRNNFLFHIIKFTMAKDVCVSNQYM
jgi:hypothetical protein